MSAFVWADIPGLEKHDRKRNMKTVPLQYVCEKLKQSHSTVLDILKRNGIKPEFEWKQGKNTFRIFDKQKIDAMCLEVKSKAVAKSVAHADAGPVDVASILGAISSMDAKLTSILEHLTRPAQ